MSENILAGPADSIFAGLIEDGRLALATERLVQRAHHSDDAGVLAALAADCARLAMALPDQEPGRSGTTDPVNLYLLSDLTPGGDEADYLKHIVDARPNERHIVLLTDVADSAADRCASACAPSALSRFCRRRG